MAVRTMMAWGVLAVALVAFLRRTIDAVEGATICS